MQFTLEALTPSALANVNCDALIVLVPKSHTLGKDALGQLVAAAVQAGDVDTSAGKMLPVYQPLKVAAPRLVLVGAGEGTPKQVMQAVAAAVGTCKAQAKQVVVSLALLGEVNAAVLHAVVGGANDATYCYALTKSKVELPKTESVTVAVSSSKGLEAGWARAVAVAHGVNVAKEWGNRPANYATPTMLGDAAKKIAKAKRMSCEVLNEKEIAALGMGSFLAVAQGSREPARFIVLRYSGAAKTVAPKVLVGKGITFDTGGISLKPGAEMDEMKFDMCGAASVLGTFAALAQLQPELNVVGLIPACENMPDGRAVKPGDVVTSMSGQTIEILNTDAEGRLILCDALTYAERYNPEVVVDIATLTGACVIALGGIRSGMYATEDALANQLLAAGDAALDLCWRMPLDDDYAEALKSNFADMGNVGGRAGGSITAAKFLHKFAQKYPWAHLDIAGTAWKGGAAKGATGRPVGLLVNFLLDGAAKVTSATEATPAAKPAAARSGRAAAKA